jgi:hypothetical protein
MTDAMASGPVTPRGQGAHKLWVATMNFVILSRSAKSDQRTSYFPAVLPNKRQN